MSGRYPHFLERTLLIEARPTTVFRFFTDEARWASWWGAGSRIDARPGGRLTIRYPGGVEAIGEVVEVSPPKRLAFTYGYASGSPIPPGDSYVTIQLSEEAGATRLRLRHEFAEARVRDEHEQGWRYQLSLFANVVANEVHAEAAQTVDEWLAAWSDANQTSREATLDRIVATDIRLRDRFSAVEGRSDVSAHLAAVHRFMPGLTLKRSGEIRHCQGLVVTDWIALAGDGSERGRGSSVLSLDGTGRLTAVTTFWN